MSILRISLLAGLAAGVVSSASAEALTPPFVQVAAQGQVAFSTGLSVLAQPMAPEADMASFLTVVESGVEADRAQPELRDQDLMPVSVEDFASLDPRNAFDNERGTDGSTAAIGPSPVGAAPGRQSLDHSTGSTRHGQALPAAGTADAQEAPGAGLLAQLIERWALLASGAGLAVVITVALGLTRLQRGGPPTLANP